MIINLVAVKHQNKKMKEEANNITAIKMKEEDGFFMALFGFLLLPMSFIADIITGVNYFSFGLFSISFIMVCFGIIIMSYHICKNRRC